MRARRRWFVLLWEGLHDATSCRLGEPAQAITAASPLVLLTGAWNGELLYRSSESSLVHSLERARSSPFRVDSLLPTGLRYSGSIPGTRLAIIRDEVLLRALHKLAWTYLAFHIPHPFSWLYKGFLR